MSQQGNIATYEEHLDLISQFIQRADGLDLNQEGARTRIKQVTDGKVLTFDCQCVEEVIPRLDSDGQDFLQVNFHDGKKILITQKLIGFKPIKSFGLDMNKLPKVVTTPDLISVVEAIEESLACDRTSMEEVEVLKKVFDSVLQGGEEVGFELAAERHWLTHLYAPTRKVSA